jgi:hypothetical protein
MAHRIRITDMRAASDFYVVDVLFARHSPWSHAVARWSQRLMNSAIDPYRPELHYMRGPGPKWRAKHGTDCEMRVTSGI